VRSVKVRQTLPKAWEAIIGEPNKLLVRLLMEETERQCGHKPDAVVVREFLKEVAASPKPIRQQATVPKMVPAEKTGSVRDTSYINRTVTGFSFLGMSRRVNHCYEILLKVCEMMRDRHPDTFEQTVLGLETPRHRCFSRNKEELMQIQAKNVPGTSIYAATKLDNDAIIALCRQVIQRFGYEAQALRIEATSSQ